MKSIRLSAFLLLIIPAMSSATQTTIELWPNDVPGETAPKAPAELSDRSDSNVTRIGKVTNPMLVEYPANPETKNGAAIIVCPGGGYGILAINKEGYEVAEWLSDLGYTCFVLQYRVPNKQDGALQDAVRAIKYVRSHATDWDVNPDKIGVMGFSAGGSLSARVSSRYDEALYELMDDVESASARPNFAVLIYPAYLDKGPDHALTAELKVDEQTPPMFLFVAGDDPHANSSLVMGSALREGKTPFELHIVPKGGHGYGMRPGNYAAETWPNLCEAWLNRTVLSQD